jgi:glucose/arabinose dehydrogenase
VEKGVDYGWPYCYYDPEQKKLVLAPEYGGGPSAAYPAHWAPTALTFYTDSGVLAEYRGGAFIGFHGSWNRAPEPQEGYNVGFQPFTGGKPAGQYQVFADGFAGSRKEPGLGRAGKSQLRTHPEERRARGVPAAATGPSIIGVSLPVAFAAAALIAWRVSNGD